MDKNIEELTLLLMYLTSWDEKGYCYNDEENIQEETTFKNSWKGYDFDILNELTDKGYLYPGKYKNKSVTLTKAGENFAQELINKYLK